MTPAKRITLEAFIRKYSEANQAFEDIVDAGVKKLREDSEAYRLAVAAQEANRAYEEYLIAAGFER